MRFCAGCVVCLMKRNCTFCNANFLMKMIIKTHMILTTKNIYSADINEMFIATKAIQQRMKIFKRVVQKAEKRILRI